MQHNSPITLLKGNGGICAFQPTFNKSYLSAFDLQVHSGKTVFSHTVLVVKYLLPLCNIKSIG